MWQACLWGLGLPQPIKLVLGMLCDLSWLAVLVLGGSTGWRHIHPTCEGWGLARGLCYPRRRDVLPRCARRSFRQQQPQHR